MNAPLPPTALALPTLPINQIVPSPTNPRKRFSEADIAGLAESIRANGLIQPITVRPNPHDTAGICPYELVVGERRWRAAKLAGLIDIPAFWRDLTDKQVLEIQVVENLQRQDVHPIEEAEGYQALITDHGYTADSLISKIGKSRSYIYARLKLLALTPKARAVCFEGGLDASIALLVARVAPSLQARALEKVTKGYDGQPLSYRTAQRELRSNFTAHLDQATWPLEDAGLVPEAGSCAACPKRAGNDPAMAEEGIDPDVCTDTVCFDSKRLARREELIDQAAAKGIAVFAGSKAEEIAPGCHAANLDRSQYVSLDWVVAGDADGRTYREILGDEAPVIAVAELSVGANKTIVELAEPTAIAEALRKAGYETRMEKKADERIDSASADREAHEAALKNENEWRKRIFAATIAELHHHSPKNESELRQALRLVATMTLRSEVSIVEMDEDLLSRHGITLPDEYDDEEELFRITDLIDAWTPGQVIAFLLDMLSRGEVHSVWFGASEAPETPHILLSAAAFAGIDPESLRPPIVAPEGVSTPTEAAPAAGLGADETAAPTGGDEGAAGDDAAGKTNPAPAAPANEKAKPSAPYAHPDNPAMTWNGRGKKPRWVEDWLADHPDQTLDALRRNINPAPAAPANAKPAPMHGDLFPDAPEFPQPNKHGVYPDDKAETLIWSSGKRHDVTITLLQIAEGWIYSTRAHYGTGYYGGPLTLSHGVAHAFRALAIANAAAKVVDQHLRPDADYGYTAAQKKSLRAWLDKIVAEAKS